MRPLRFTYSPVAANLTRYAASVSASPWVLTNTTTADGLAHTITIKNNSVTDYSSDIAAIIGYNVDGNVILEALALPTGSATVTSVRYYKSIISIIPGVSPTGGDTMSIGMGAGFTTPTIALDYRSGIVGFDVVLISGTATYTVQFTNDDIQNHSGEFNWLNSSDTDVVNKTTSASSNFVAVPIAMRLIFTAQTGNPGIGLNITQRNF